VQGVQQPVTLGALGKGMLARLGHHCHVEAIAVSCGVKQNSRYRKFADGNGLGGARRATAAMIDWITILIEAVGVVTLLMWIAIPIREFRDILPRPQAQTPRRVLRRGRAARGVRAAAPITSSCTALIVTPIVSLLTALKAAARLFGVRSGSI
jgi:hypothetical protein